jgi:hypothetical protein
MQKKIIGTAAGDKSRLSCRKLFQKFNMLVLPLSSEYILCLLVFVVENLEDLLRNTDEHSLNTGYKYDVHMPNSNLTKYQRQLHLCRYQVFSYLPRTVYSWLN